MKAIQQFQVRVRWLDYAHFANGQWYNHYLLSKREGLQYYRQLEDSVALRAAMISEIKATFMTTHSM